ncbi:MAG: hypothetical protein ABWY30_02035, partial [Microterricola sp.]
GNPFDFGTLLFDLHEDPEQLNPLRDDELELRMANLMLGLMRANDAPGEQYERLGFPLSGPALPEHLLVAEHWAQMQAARVAAVRTHEMPADSAVVRLTLTELLGDARTRPVLLEALPALTSPGLVAMFGGGNVVEAAATHADWGAEQMCALEQRLQRALAA